MYDLLIKNATLQDGTKGVDIACSDGTIGDITCGISGDFKEVIDANGYLVTPPFVDAHFHVDCALLHGHPYINESGELYEGIDHWLKIKETLTVEDVKQRARRICAWAIANGTLYIRAQTDICDPQLRALQALIELREEIKPYLNLQVVAFPQDGYLRDPNAVSLMRRALDMGADVIGGIPDYELTVPIGHESIRQLCELAVDKERLVDMHIDQTPDPQSRQVEAITAEITRLKLGGRASASHCPSMTNFHDYYANKLIAQMAQAGMNVVVQPMTAATCWGVMTRVGQLYDAGVNIAFGQDCVADPWYPLGKCEMLDIAHMAIVYGRLLAEKKKHMVFNSITYGGARALNIEGYGIAKGKRADFVILQATNPMEAIRIRPVRLAVVRGGQVIARQEKQISRVSLGQRKLELDFTIENIMALKH
jgi:cytosine/creatinine deaminase